LLISFQWDDPLVREPWVSGIVIAITSILMVSRLPTPSIKYMKLQRQHRALAAVCFAILAGCLIAWPWATMTIGLLIYVASIPFAIFAHHPRYAARTSA
jgi:CDP-diacylglycerol--serine O-phosphatidyltransferase